MEKNAIDELNELAAYLKGMADSQQGSKTLERASHWLRQAAYNVCGQGYFGCEGGRECDSDHK